MDLGRLGILSDGLGSLSDADAATVAVELEESGWNTVWLPPSRGRSIHTNAIRFLARTRRLKVAVGAYSNGTDIPSGRGALTDAYNHRLLVHLNVERDRSVHDLAVALDTLDRGPRPVAQDRRLLTGSGLTVMRLAQERALGIRPEIITPAGIAAMRSYLGDLPLIACVIPVVPFTNADTARRVARHFLTSSLARPECALTLRQVGYTDADFHFGGSDRLLNEVVAWGGAGSITERIEQFVESGADHIVLHHLPCGASRYDGWRVLADVAG
ncbi:hypothetical protein [Amycolatopsis sp. FDAARGOS 1241]|uniref:hypothetical protein n=1 Tax=Amycolatopsis sp. FDAARGOS 1241 TaxID=2778070 RepID=UPI00351C8402